MLEGDCHRLSRRLRIVSLRKKLKISKKNGKYYVKAESSADWSDYQDILHSANFIIDSWEAEVTETTYYMPGVKLSSGITSTNHVAGHFLIDY